MDRSRVHRDMEFKKGVFGETKNTFAFGTRRLSLLSISAELGS